MSPLRPYVLSVLLILTVSAAEGAPPQAQERTADTVRTATPDGAQAADSASGRADSVRAQRGQRERVAAPASSSPQLEAPPPDTVRIDEAAGDALGEYNPAYLILSELNEGVTFGEPANLRTPQAALEYFARQSSQRQWQAAAQALNLNFVPADQRAALAPRIAERLYYILDKQVGFDWEGLPDRPDGISEGPSAGNNPLAGQPRRSLRIGSVPVDGRDMAIRLQRVRVGEEAPVWVFSPQTVGNVDALYARYGPGPVDRLMPSWAKVQVLGQTALWGWLALLGLGVLSIFAALVVRRIAQRRLSESDRPWVRAVSDQLALPIALVAAFVFLYLTASIALALPVGVTTFLLILVIGAVTWLAMRVVNLFTDHLARDGYDDISDLSGDEETERKRQLTYLSVGRRVLFFVLFLLALGVIIGQFEQFRAIGLTFAASAGVATVLLGVAAQPILGNILAGLQIALSRPVRIGDNVLFEDNWGWVEDITYTYVLIQTWDQRRLIVPLRYFVTHPVENWTKRDAHLVKPIILYADYSLDVDRIRDYFADILKDDEDWDEEKEPTVQVVGVHDDTMEIRALCSAKDPSIAWDLHCRLREQLVAFVRDLDDGRHLPRRRVELSGDTAAGPPVEVARGGRDEDTGR